MSSSASLKRFIGRPDDFSPKARFFGWFFGAPKPFDRHDWTIERNNGKEVRYVIDYYADPVDPKIFSVDVRPAIDSISALSARIKMFFSLLFKTE